SRRKVGSPAFSASASNVILSSVVMVALLSVSVGLATYSSERTTMITTTKPLRCACVGELRYAAWRWSKFTPLPGTLLGETTRELALLLRDIL
ncbi:MAG: hypothetical protein HQL59_07120, partial [Magnetococcales bacterium]|nr:hypothetical protein [Magnetococcales bacterium]